MTFDFEPLLRPDLPPAAQRWNGFPRYNFVGGHNDAASVPTDDLVEAARTVIAREGPTLATYGLESGAQGYLPLRRFVAETLTARTRMTCSSDDVLMVSGSLQALDLVNGLLLSPGDCVLVEEATYGGALTRLHRHGVETIGVGLDQDGMRMDDLAAVLERLQREGRRPKFIYTIPTVQNPTGSVMPEDRRVEMLRLAEQHGVPIFEDDCYADLLWDGPRPPAIRALDNGGRVIYCGSFSKTIAPALRVGFLVADWPVLSRLLPLKTDGGTGALEQLVLAEYVTEHFDSHVGALTATLRAKRDVMIESLQAEFGTAAEFDAPKGGIFIWVTLPGAVDTGRLAQAAQAEGVTLNPGAEWMADPEAGRNRMRLCFANPTEATIREGVAALAEICRRETGVPRRSANVEHGAG